MKVIIHGNTYVMQRCPNCNCCFEYVEKDIQTSIFSFKDNYKYVECPECSYDVEVIEKEQNND